MYSARMGTCHQAVIAVALLSLTACDHLSHVGDDTDSQPQAVVTALGQPFTNDASGNMNTTVRAGADVVLSGKNSLKGVNDAGVPLITFKWEQVSPGNNAVQLIRRTSNTVSFTAPQVTQDTTLKFKLTASNYKGVTTTATAQVLVKAIRDGDHFLQYLKADNSFPVVLTTQNVIAANPAALATDTLPVTITITRLATFTDRTGIVQTRVALGQPVTITASWGARVGTSASCTSTANPTVHLPIPRINQDDLLPVPVNGFPDAVVLSDVMEPADIDGLTLEIRVDLSSTNSTVTAATPGVCINGATTANASGTVLPTESLYAANIQRDSKASAQAYFAAIDPTNAKDTLDKWLTANGFDSSAAGYNADTHAVYTNNFDLGFGRDMYMKFGACDAGAAMLPLEQRIGKCDVAAVVINYIDLEAAAKKLNPVVAVAMEYSASPGTGARYTKFYTFTPDTRTGVFRRVLSVNLDRRGEQYMPQTCVVCHGGLPGTAASYATNADVDATFLPWDLDSLLFADTDPGFSNKPMYAGLQAQYTRAAQEAKLKLLNQGAYLTYSDPANYAGRFALARELVEKWYGGAGLQNATYDDSEVPTGWQPAGTNNNPPDSGTIYHDVFARHCRSCHVLQAPAPANGDPRTATIAPQGVTTPLPACGGDPLLVNTSVGIASQVPMGCYWEFAHAPNLATRLSDAQMPFARRTVDRMWTVATGATQSAGQKLQAHLLAAQGMTVATPGVPVACIDAFGTPITNQNAVAVTRGAWITLGSSCSHFLSDTTWTLSSPAGSVASLVGADTASPEFLADVQGDYILTLSSSDGTATATAVARVPVVAPVAGSGSSGVALAGNGTATVDVDVMQLPGSSSRDALSSLSIVNTTGVTASLQSLTSGSAVIHVAVNSLAGGTVTYQLTDVDGDQSGVGTITISVSASIVANNATVSVNTNGQLVVNLSNLVSAASQPFTLAIQSQPSINRGRGTGSVSVPSNGDVVYISPPGVTSHFNGMLISAASIDSFVYKACFVAQPAACATGTITVNLNGTQSSTAVNTVMSTICSVCHQTNPPTGGLATDVNPLYMISPTYNSVAARKAFYCMLTTLGPVNEAGTLPKQYVNIVNPDQSYIYLKPQDLTPTPHGGGVVASDTTQPPLSTILAWINEGAYFTESSSQTCP